MTTQNNITSQGVEQLAQCKATDYEDMYLLQKILRAALTDQVQSHDLLGKQEPLGAEFEKVLYDNLDSLYSRTGQLQSVDRDAFSLPKLEQQDEREAFEECIAKDGAISAHLVAVPTFITAIVQ